MRLSSAGSIVALGAALLGSVVTGSAANAEELQLQAGGMVIVAPRYEGAKEYRVVGVPLVAPAGSSLSNGIIQFKGPDDLRFRVLSGGGFEAGPLVGWRFDRDQNDATRLRGLGDVDGSGVVGGFVSYSAGMFTPFISYHHGITGDQDTGGLLRFGTEANTSISNIPLRLTVGANYADDDYMDTYFSITAAQSAASVARLRADDADAGVKDVYFGLSSDVAITDRWSLKLMGQYSHLIGDAADSPIVESESQWFGAAGLTYRFGVGR